MLRSLALWCYRRRRTVLAVWLLALVGCVFLGKSVGGKYSQSLRLPGTESQKAADLLDADFPSRAGDSGQIVVAAAGRPRHRGADAMSPSCSIRSRAVPGVADVVSPYSLRGRAPDRRGRRGRVRDRRLHATGSRTSRPATTDRIVALAEHARSLGLQVELGGHMFEENGRPAGPRRSGCSRRS